jgi:pSer/pThr/pTyr-binding forkhead associated (FHA) protein
MNKGIGHDPIPGVAPQFTQNTAQLKLLNGPGAKRLFTLNQITTVIGRNDPPNIKVDIDLTDCEINNPPAVSRRHAEIFWVEGDLQIVDLNSSNGTFIDGKKLSPLTPENPHEPVSLNPGTKVKLGNLEFEVIVDE